MCGRFAQFAAPDVLAAYFDLNDLPADLTPRYNLTPGQAVAAVRSQDGVRRLTVLRWGLVPFWAKDAAIGRRLVNARLETLVEKPAFREAWPRRRCLIAASGFYEWGEGARGRRPPFFVRPAAEPLLALAGLWERWRDASGEPLETCVIVTTAASGKLAQIHDRMPLMIARADQDLWLDPRTSVEAAAELALRGPTLDVWPVSAAVNDPRNDGEDLIRPQQSGMP